MMQKNLKRFRVLLAAACAVALVAALAQEQEEDSAIVAEDLLIEEALNGALVVEDPVLEEFPLDDFDAEPVSEDAVPEEPAVVESIDIEPMDDALALEEAVPEEAVVEMPEAPPAPVEEKGLSVESAAEEADQIGRMADALLADDEQAEGDGEDPALLIGEPLDVPPDAVVDAAGDEPVAMTEAEEEPDVLFDAAPEDVAEEPALVIDEPVAVAEEERLAAPEEEVVELLADEAVPVSEEPVAAPEEEVVELLADEAVPVSEEPVAAPEEEVVELWADEAVPMSEAPVEAAEEERLAAPEEEVGELLADEAVPMSEAPVAAAEEEVVELLADEAVPVSEAPPVPGAIAPDEDPDRIVEQAFEEALAEGVPEAPVLPAPAEGPVSAPSVAVVPEPAPQAMPVESPEAAAARQEARERAAQVAGLLDGEILRRQAFERHAHERYAAAKSALNAKRYQEAVRGFEQTLSALNRVGDRPDVETLRGKAQRGLGECYYRLALIYREQRDFENADKMAKSALVYGHPRVDKLIALIAADREAPEEEEPAVEPRGVRWDDEEFLADEADVRERLKLGRQYFVTREYDKAQLAFESVLKRDPHNSEAIRLLKKVAQKKYDIASMELETTRKDMMYELRKTWSRRNYAAAEQTGELDTLTRKPRRAPEEAKARKLILEKMERIIIPELDFRQANIHDVIDFLQDASVEFDTTERPEGAQPGVNIILNLRGKQAAAAPAGPADPFAAALAPADGGGAGDIQHITFSARYISLLEALDIVTEVADLKYRIEGSVVMVVPSDAPAGAIVHRMYDVLPTVIERISMLSADGGSGGGGGDFMSLDSGGGLGGDTVDLKEFFGGMGVLWPQGSSIKYISALGKLAVANTAENLIVFENILSVLDVVPKQVEIEARFVEVLQTDLNSLGFEWLLTDDWEVATKQGQGNVPLGGQQQIVVPENADAGGFTQGNRYLSGGIEGFSDLPIADSVLSIQSVLTNPELMFVLHALEQRGNADLLSAPKVTTQSGQEAAIRVVTEYIYPTDFEVTPVTAELEGGGSQIIGGVVEPSGFEMREVGVILTVLPEVSPEGLINLNLRPEVVEEPTFKNYGTTFTDPNGNVQQLNMEQPFFKTRRVETSILIYNGATVVMGGMITERRYDVDDKVPVLGDIPILGRLFRSRYEQSQKRNLLIFVTAKLVDPAGIPVPKAESIDEVFVDAEQE
jgi:general secretion pathway protein D